MGDYTVPTVRMPNGSYVMDSKAIALALEPLFPEPSLRLGSPILAEVEEAWMAAFVGLVPVLAPKMAREVLSGSTIQHHYKAREKNFGMPLDEFEEKYGGEQAWEKAMPALQKFGEALKTDPSGLLLHGLDAILRRFSYS